MREVFHDDIERIRGTLEDHRREAAAKRVVLFDREGHGVTLVGSAVPFDIDLLAALVPAAFAASRAAARAGDENAELLLQGGAHRTQLVIAGESCMLATTFDEATTLDAVRRHAREAAERVAAILEEIARRPPRGDDPDGAGSVARIPPRPTGPGGAQAQPPPRDPPEA